MANKNKKLFPTPVSEEPMDAPREVVAASFRLQNSSDSSNGNKTSGASIKSSANNKTVYRSAVCSDKAIGATSIAQAEKNTKANGKKGKRNKHNGKTANLHDSATLSAPIVLDSAFHNEVCEDSLRTGEKLVYLPREAVLPPNTAAYSSPVCEEPLDQAEIEAVRIDTSILDDSAYIPDQLPVSTIVEEPLSEEPPAEVPPVEEPPAEVPPVEEPPAEEPIPQLTEGQPDEEAEPEGIVPAQGDWTIEGEEEPAILPEGPYGDVYDRTEAYIDDLMTEDVYKELMSALSDGKATVELKKRLMIKAIDEEWVNMIEDSIVALDDCVRKPTRDIEQIEEVKPIEVSRDITSRSLQHLAQHSDYISKVDGDDIQPSKILNVYNEETILTYENKFINTLISRLYIFVRRRVEQATKQDKDEKNTCLSFVSEFNHGNQRGKVTVQIEMSEPPADGEVIKDYTYTTDLWRRVTRLDAVVRGYMSSEFVKAMGKNFVRPPIMRTNAIIKNKNMRQALVLWQFIESYEGVGYGLVVDEDVEKVEEKCVRDLYKLSAIQYLIFRHHIRNEFIADNILDRLDEPATISPRLVDNLKPIESTEFDVYDDKKLSSHLKKSLTMNADDLQVLEAIDVALTAEAELRGESYTPPQEDIKRQGSAKKPPENK